VRESRWRPSRSAVREPLVSLSDGGGSSPFLVVFPLDRRSLRGKDIGLAAVVEGGARTEATTGFGGSAWVSFGVGWQISDCGDGGRGTGCTWLVPFLGLGETPTEALRLLASLLETMFWDLSAGCVFCSLGRAP